MTRPAMVSRPYIRAHTDAKHCWSHAVHAQASAGAFPMLSDIPQLRALYTENRRQEAGPVLCTG